MPTQLGQLSRTIYFDVYGLRISGSLPKQIGGMGALQSTFLPTALDGTLPTELGNLRSLAMISLEHTRVSGSLPSTFGRLANLRVLSADYNYLSGTFPTQLGLLGADGGSIYDDARRYAFDLRFNYFSYPETVDATVAFREATSLCARATSFCDGLPPYGCSAFGSYAVASAVVGLEAATLGFHRKREETEREMGETEGGCHCALTRATLGLVWHCSR
jgi:hypothetical protein